MKMGQKRKSFQKKKKSQLLQSNLNPIPFVPHKTLDLSRHHNLLRLLGLWDFARIEFHRIPICTDLLRQFIANFDRTKLCTYVNGDRIAVSRADLARALKIPVKRIASAGEVLAPATEDSIGFLEDFVFNWMLLRDNGDARKIPDEISDWIKDIKDGNFERVDWAGIIWFMVEKELVKRLELTNCFYATHMMCLIKFRREDSLHLPSRSSLSEKIEEQERLYKAKIAELQRENYLMSKLVKGYKEAMKQTQRAFAEYRGNCECRCKKLDEPLYKEVNGSSGLVLSTKEIEEREIERKVKELRV